MHALTFSEERAPRHQGRPRSMSAASDATWRDSWRASGLVLAAWPAKTDQAQRRRSAGSILEVCSTLAFTTRRCWQPRFTGFPPKSCSSESRSLRYLHSTDLVEIFDSSGSKDSLGSTLPRAGNLGRIGVNCLEEIPRSRDRAVWKEGSRSPGGTVVSSVLRHVEPCVVSTGWEAAEWG